MESFSVRKINRTISKDKNVLFALKDISFEMEPGTVMGVIGRNGSGKSVLLRTLLGSYRFDDCRPGTNYAPDIVLDGISFKNDDGAYKSKVAFVLNKTIFDVGVSVKQNINLYGRFYENFDFAGCYKRLEEYGVKKTATVSRLSTGQQVMMQLAFALSYDAKLYIFDEAVGNLDVKSRELIYSIVRELAAAGKYILFATHLIDEIENIADYILWMQNYKRTGMIRFVGTTMELQDKYMILEGDGQIEKLVPDALIYGSKQGEYHSEYLVDVLDESAELPQEVREKCRYATLEEIMYYIEKDNKK